MIDAVSGSARRGVVSEDCVCMLEDAERLDGIVGGAPDATEVVVEAVGGGSPLSGMRGPPFDVADEDEASIDTLLGESALDCIPCAAEDVGVPAVTITEPRRAGDCCPYS